jgi:hypothetical protein
MVSASQARAVEVVSSLLMAAAAIGGLWWVLTRRREPVTIRPVHGPATSQPSLSFDSAGAGVRIDGVDVAVHGLAPHPPRGRKVFVVGEYLVDVPANSNLAARLTLLCPPR